MLLTGRKFCDLGARGGFRFMSTRSMPMPTAQSPFARIQNVFKYTVRTSLIVSGILFVGAYSEICHVISVFVSREYLSIEEVKQFHELEQNLLGDELTLFDSAWSKYLRIRARYNAYIKPIVVAREPHFTPAYRAELKLIVALKLLNKDISALQSRDARELIRFVLSYVTLMLTDQELEIVRKKLEQYSVSVKREWDVVGKTEESQS